MKRIVVFSTSDIQTLERNCTSRGIPLPPKARPEDDTEWLQDQLEGPLPQLYGFNSWLEARDYLMYGNYPLDLDTVIVSGSDFRRLYP